MKAPVIVPAETLQVEEDIVGGHPWLAVPIAFVFAVLLTIVGAHAL